MPQAINTVSISAGGVSIQRAITRTGDGVIAVEVTLPAATAGTLTTRTDDDTGVITVASHTVIVGDKVDVFWSGGRRYGMTVSAQDATTITVGTLAGEIGAGDVFPAQSTAVTIVKQTLINVAIDGDEVEIIGLSLETTDSTLATKGHAQFEDAAGDDIAAINLTANVPSVYDVAGGATNPFTGDPITTCRASNANSTTAATLKIVGVYDATP